MFLYNRAADRNPGGDRLSLHTPGFPVKCLVPTRAVRKDKTLDEDSGAFRRRKVSSEQLKLMNKY